jgi:hypothetical protein
LRTEKRLDGGKDLSLPDVRHEGEPVTSNIGWHLIPLAELSMRVNELDSQ